MVTADEVEINAAGSAAPGQPLATARQSCIQMNLFFVDGNGAVNAMGVVDLDTWQKSIEIWSAPLAVDRLSELV